MKIAYQFVAACALLVTAASSFSHVVLDVPLAPAGSGYKAALRVSHGCAGSPTTAIKVRMPEGFQGAKPMPKPGWTVSTHTEKLARPYVSHGKPITEDVTEINWLATSRDNWLPDNFFDEFVWRGTLPAQAGVLWFSVIQMCENGSNEWTQVPAQGTSTQGMKFPAALLEVTPSAHAGHQH